MNTSLIRSLYTLHAPTGDEWALICFVREYVSRNIPEASVSIDRLGNVYITKGEAGVGYPTLACHLDQVQQLHSDDFEVKEEDGILYGWSPEHQRREGPGADDKNGIYVCLRCLEECPRLKVFMAVGEEKGCIGSNRAQMSFFSDSLYVLEADCKGGKEVHTHLRGIPCASADFERALRLEHHGYELTDGKGSDILALTLNNIGVSCANIPAGYHQPHKDDEYTVVVEIEKCLAFALHTVRTLDQRFPHTYTSHTEMMAEREANKRSFYTNLRYANLYSRKISLSLQPSQVFVIF